MTTTFDHVINLKDYPIDDPGFRANCKQKLDMEGALVIPNLLTTEAIASIKKEGEKNQHLAYYTTKNHNIFLEPTDPGFSPNHPRNREVTSSKGCITTDQIPASSILKKLYHDACFQEFLCYVLDEKQLYEYADPLSSINIHYAGEGQKLGWHYDNSSFAISLMIQEPVAGGEFQYVKDLRDESRGEMNYRETRMVLDGQVEPKTLTLSAGTLVMFRGRNSIHRVTPVIGQRSRMLVVLAYNTREGISLSESARMTFYGRV